MDPLLEALGFALIVGVDTAQDDFSDGNDKAGPLRDHLEAIEALHRDYVEESEHEGTEPTLKDFFLYAHHVL